MAESSNKWTRDGEKEEIEALIARRKETMASRKTLSTDEQRAAADRVIEDPDQQF